MMTPCAELTERSWGCSVSEVSLRASASLRETRFSKDATRPAARTCAGPRRSISAPERTRTSTSLRSLDPESSASTNSATGAWGAKYNESADFAVAPPRASAVHHREVRAPGAHRLAVLLRHHPRRLRDVPQVVRHPGGEELPQRHRPELGVL